jgi:hypothetical protein
MGRITFQRWQEHPKEKAVFSQKIAENFQPNENGSFLKVAGGCNLSYHWTRTTGVIWHKKFCFVKAFLELPEPWRRNFLRINKA